MNAPDHRYSTFALDVHWAARQLPDAELAKHLEHCALPRVPRQSAGTSARCRVPPSRRLPRRHGTRLRDRWLLAPRRPDRRRCGAAGLEARRRSQAWRRRWRAGLRRDQGRTGRTGSRASIRTDERLGRTRRRTPGRCASATRGVRGDAARQCSRPIGSIFLDAHIRGSVPHWRSASVHAGRRRSARGGTSRWSSVATHSTTPTPAEPATSRRAPKTCER